MKTEILSAEHGLKKAAELIKAGELVAFATETVYGLGANALDELAVAKIFKAKGRPQDNPLIVHVADFEALKALANELPKEAEKLAEAFMPGAITLVVKAKNHIPKITTAGLNTVGVRIPSHSVAQAFLKECGCPVAAPSANTSTRVSPTKASHVYQDLAGKIPLILDGGSAEVGIESTIISLVDGITLLRPGVITKEQIEQVLGMPVSNPIPTKTPLAPGMAYKHYSPKTPVYLSANPTLSAKGKNAIVITSKMLGKTHSIAAKNLYSLLIESDQKADIIIIEKPPQTPEWQGVNNRLKKTTQGKEL